MRAPDQALLVDLGSTFTKLRIVDLDRGRMLAATAAPSTVDTDVTLGLEAAFDALPDRFESRGFDGYVKAASSSAAGGLRIVAVGLVEGLTASAAKAAALNAGGKVVGVFANGLTEEDVADIRSRSPDLILLAGGTDGGDTRCIVGNAESIAASGMTTPVIVAGNRNARATLRDILTDAGIDHELAPNVLPSLDEMQPQGCADVIRDIFMDSIVEAKGLSRAESLIGRVAMPTPQAVLEACGLAGDTEEGLPTSSGLICVDVGGATTDVYSVGSGRSPGRGTVLKGPKEPHLKRTVEADLGMRVSARTLVDAAGRDDLAERVGIAPGELDAYVDRVEADPGQLPDSPEEGKVDVALGRAAVSIGVRRHVGTVEIAYGPEGEIRIQSGKDLRDIPLVVGTGGVLSQNARDVATEILAGARATEDDPRHLLPGKPELGLDRDYSLFAVGLLAEIDRGAALGLLRSTLSIPASATS